MRVNMCRNFSRLLFTSFLSINIIIFVHTFVKMTRYLHACAGVEAGEGCGCVVFFIILSDLCQTTTFSLPRRIIIMAHRKTCVIAALAGKI